MSTYPTRREFIHEATLRIAAARHANPDFEQVIARRCLDAANEIADTLEQAGVASWLPETQEAA